MSMMVSFCAVLFPTRCHGWDLELNWVSFWGFSFLLLGQSKADYVLVTVPPPPPPPPPPIFKVNTQPTKVYLIAKIEIFLEQMDGYSSDLIGYIIVTGLRHIRLRFWWPWPHFQGHSLVCKISLEPVNGFSSNLHRCTIRTSWLDYGDLDLIFRVIEG